MRQISRLNFTKYRWVIGTLVTVGLGLISGTAAAMRDEAKISRFKKTVAFSEAISLEKDPAKYRFSPADLLAAPAMSGKTWQVDQRQLYDVGGTETIWIFKSGQESVVVAEFFAVKNKEAARDFFLRVANENTMMDSPFRRTQPLIGTLSVAVPRDDARDVISLAGHVCLRITTHNSKIDAIAMSAWLHKNATELSTRTRQDKNSEPDDSAQALMEGLDKAFKVATKAGFYATWTDADLKGQNWHLHGSSKSAVAPMYFVYSMQTSQLIYQNDNTSVKPVAPEFLQTKSDASFRLITRDDVLRWGKTD